MTTYIWETDFSGIPSGNFLPRAGWVGDAPWQVYQGDVGDGRADVIYPSLSAGALLRDTGSENMKIVADYKTSTIANASVGGVICRAKEDLTTGLGFELVKHEGGVGGVPTPEDKYVLYIRAPAGGDEELVTILAAGIGYEVWYNPLAIEVVDNHVICTVDGDVVIEHDLTGPQAAKIAGGTWGGAVNFTGNANYNTLAAYPVEAAAPVLQTADLPRLVGTSTLRALSREPGAATRALGRLVGTSTLRAPSRAAGAATRALGRLTGMSAIRSLTGILSGTTPWLNRRPATAELVSAPPADAVVATAAPATAILVPTAASTATIIQE